MIYKFLTQQFYKEYIYQYVKAKDSDDSNKQAPFVYSTLPYFEDLIDYKKDILEIE